MDQFMINRFVSGYRQVADEKLAELLSEDGSLTEEASHALSQVVNERPSAESIRAEAAARKAQKRTIAGERPTLGFWLGFLTFGLCVAPIRVIAETYGQLRMTEDQYPALLEMGNWQAYKSISMALAFSVVVASFIAVRAIHKGTTHRDLERIIGALWYIAVGIFILDLISSALLFGGAVAQEILNDQGTIPQLVVAIFFTALWTAYLTLSDRCRRRYPRTTTPLQSVLS